MSGGPGYTGSITSFRVLGAGGPPLIVVVQRVLEASVTVGDERVGAIGRGLLALAGVERGDGPAEADGLAKRLAELRMFDDADGRMNLDLAAAGGEALLVSQFTLAADTRRGRRPGFSGAAAPDEARALFDRFVAAFAGRCPRTRTGRFGAEMRVALVNDGPVTFVLRSGDRAGAAR